jgi:hypothetical protein
MSGSIKYCLLLGIAIVMANNVHAGEIKINNHTIGCVQSQEDGCIDIVTSTDKALPKNCTVIDIMYDLMNIDGKDVNVACKQTKSPNGKEKKSVPSHYVYECGYGDIKIKVDSLIKSDGNESHSGKSTITIEEKGTKLIIKGKQAGGC